jgi:hypothetical protein
MGMPVTVCTRGAHMTEQPLPRAALRWCVALALLGTSCTPFQEVDQQASSAAGRPAEPDADAGSTAGKAGDSMTAMPVRARAAEGEACMQDGAHTCSTVQADVPLRCEAASWARQAPCEQDERCETTEGPDEGMCVAIPRECVGRGSGDEYCDGDELRVCGDTTLPARSCGEKRRCRMIGARAECVCAPPFADRGNGCEPPTSCGEANGGCDTLTTCRLEANVPTCSACPSGYMRGDGKEGCKPELVTLAVSGMLSPAFSPALHEYRVRVPLLQQRLVITAVGPAGSSIEINGSPVERGSDWTSTVLPFGEQQIALVLTSGSGFSTRYDLTVERMGVQEAYIKASRPDAEDAFGSSVALYGDTLVVGAFAEDSGAGGVNADQANNSVVDSGAAYVFVRRGNIWSQEAYLKAESPARNDFFGGNVAIWEDTIAVGATRASPLGNVPSTHGVVDIFVRSGSTWTFQKRLASPETGSFDLFGWSFALQKDRLAVGAPYDAAGAQRSGALYVFERSGTEWSSPKKLKTMQPIAIDALGWSVALDGDTLLAGAIERNGMSTDMGGPGSAFVFVKDGDAWTQQQKLQAPMRTDGASFGWSVTLEGDTAAVGAPRVDLLRSTAPGDVHIFQRTGTRWASVGSLQADVPRRSDFFGSSVALAGDMLAIGASGDASSSRGLRGDPTRRDLPESGAIYLYGQQGSDWVRSAYIKASNPDRRDYMGDRVALFGDTVVTASVFESSASMGIGGDDTSNTLGKSGAVYVFR